MGGERFVPLRAATEVTASFSTLDCAEDGVHSGHRAGNRKDDQGQVCPKAPVVDRTGDHEGLRTM